MTKAKWFSFGILFLFFSFTAKGQMDNIRLGLTLTPLPLLEFYQGGNIRLGLQYQFYPRTFVLAEFGKYLDALHYNTRNLEGYNWRLGFQYNYSSLYYFSIDYFYKDHSFDLRDELEINGLTTEREYRLVKFANSVSLKWGRMRWSKNKRIYADFYMGAGVRLRNVQRFGLSEEELNFLTAESIVYDRARKTGRIISPDFSWGIRLGWAVFRKEKLARTP